MQNEPITIFGDGGQGRCFIYVEDLAEGNVAVMQSKARNEIFNLGGSEFITVNDIVEALRENFRDLKVEHSSPRPGDFKGVLVDSDKARRLLGWKPKTQYKVGLKKYVDLVREEKTRP